MDWDEKSKEVIKMRRNGLTLDDITTFVSFFLVGLLLAMAIIFVNLLVNLFGPVILLIIFLPPGMGIGAVILRRRIKQRYLFW